MNTTGLSNTLTLIRNNFDYIMLTRFYYIDNAVHAMLTRFYHTDDAVHAMLTRFYYSDDTVHAICLVQKQVGSLSKKIKNRPQYCGVLLKIIHHKKGILPFGGMAKINLPVYFSFFRTAYK